MIMDREARGERLERLVSNSASAAGNALVKALRPSSAVFDQLRGAVTAYIWHTLTQAYPGQRFAPDDGLLSRHSAAIMALPNRTPNGVLLPRSETFLSFNLVHQALARTFGELGIYPGLSRIQRSCNVRILSGTPNAEAEARPLASSKLHTDIWAGEPLGSVLFNILVLGEPDAVDLEFFEPDSFPESLLKPIEDYELGKEMANRSTKCPLKCELGVVYISDSLSLHKTVKRRPGYRVSIDLRAIPSTLLPGESSDSSSSRAEYVDTETWRRIGTTIILTSADPLDSFHRRQRGENIAREASFSLTNLD